MAEDGTKAVAVVAYALVLLLSLEGCVLHARRHEVRPFLASRNVFHVTTVLFAIFRLAWAAMQFGDDDDIGEFTLARISTILFFTFFSTIPLLWRYCLSKGRPQVIRLITFVINAFLYIYISVVLLVTYGRGEVRKENDFLYDSSIILVAVVNLVYSLAFLLMGILVVRRSSNAHRKMLVPFNIAVFITFVGFLLRTALLLDRPITGEKRVNPDLWLIFGYIVPEVLPSTAFLILMRVNPASKMDNFDKEDEETIIRLAHASAGSRGEAGVDPETGTTRTSGSGSKIVINQSVYLNDDDEELDSPTPLRGSRSGGRLSAIMDADEEVSDGEEDDDQRQQAAELIQGQEFKSGKYLEVSVTVHFPTKQNLLVAVMSSKEGDEVRSSPSAGQRVLAGSVIAEDAASSELPKPAPQADTKDRMEFGRTEVKEGECRASFGTTFLLPMSAHSGDGEGDDKQVLFRVYNVTDFDTEELDKHEMVAEAVVPVGSLREAEDKVVEREMMVLKTRRSRGVSDKPSTQRTSLLPSSSSMEPKPQPTARLIVRVEGEMDVEPNPTRVLRTYTFLSGQEMNTKLHVQESIVESEFTFEVPFAVLSAIFPERKRQTDEAKERLRAPRESTLGHKGSDFFGELLDIVSEDTDKATETKWLQSVIDRRQEICKIYSEAMDMFDNYTNQYKGLTFKPTTLKGDKTLRHVATNLHEQSLVVRADGHHQSAQYTTTTVGAPCAYVYGFKRGGLRQLLDKRRRCVTELEDMKDPRNRLYLFRKLEGLNLDIELRSDVVVSQALSALLSSFMQHVRTNRDDQMLMDKLVHVGFLVEWESLLSTHGSERGMLGDMQVAVAALKNMAVRFVEKPPTEKRRVRLHRNGALDAVGENRDETPEALRELVESAPSKAQLPSYKPTTATSHRLTLTGQSSGAGRIVLDIYDLGGQAALRSMHKEYFKSADVFIMVFDITSRDSFQEIASLRNYINEHRKLSDVPCVLVGTKIDLIVQRAVPTTEACEFANSVGCSYIEASVLVKANIQAILLELMALTNASILSELVMFQPKVVVCGSDKVGKSCLVKAMVDKVESVDIPDLVFAQSNNRRSVAITNASQIPEWDALLMDVMVPAAELALLPGPLQKGRPVSIVPVVFTQGINEAQTIANAVGESKLQEEINAESLKVLKQYYSKCRRWYHSQRDNSKVEQLDSLLVQIENTVQSSKREKNLEILMMTEDFARLMEAGRITSCKSAKDRTSMSVTVEQARLLAHRHGLPPRQVGLVADVMRTVGVRRANVKKNIGKGKYAFNALQRKMLPAIYRAPKGTGGGGQA